MPSGPRAARSEIASYLRSSTGSHSVPALRPHSGEKATDGLDVTGDLLDELDLGRKTALLPNEPTDRHTDLLAVEIAVEVEQVGLDEPFPRCVVLRSAADRDRSVMPRPVLELDDAGVHAVGKLRSGGGPDVRRWKAQSAPALVARHDDTLDESFHHTKLVVPTSAAGSKVTARRHRRYILSP